MLDYSFAAASFYYLSVWMCSVWMLLKRIRRGIRISCNLLLPSGIGMLAISKRNKMQEPKTKAELIELSQNNYKNLIDLVSSQSKEEIKKEFPEGTMNRNVRDVLAHLHHWHLMFLDWYKIGMNGENPDMPSKGYTWKTLLGLNKEIWKEYQNVELETVQELLDISFANVQKIISNHTNKEIYEKNKYKWTGEIPLGGYLISNTSSHYDWAIRLINKSLKWK